jgi:UDP-N-acetyl-D-glucosamine dehydrogenase
VDDVRESPALDVIGLLCEKGADVVYHDPYVPQLSLHNGAMMSNVAFSTDLLSEADCVVIITDHRSMNWQTVADHSHLIVDTRNAVGKLNSTARVVSL